jgi:UDP-N-acetylmuramate--alanine ligase
LTLHYGGMNVFSGKEVFFVGIKGTGMCALAELLHGQGVRISGSDCADVFYTDAILRERGIPYFENFDRGHIHSGIDMVIYSAAYSAETNPELAEADARGIPVLKYTDALGEYSGYFDSSGIAGVHGKTTTTALAGTVMQAAGLPVQVLAGSAVGSFGGRSTLIQGDSYFVAETCEYRRHFLSFKPRRIVLTSVESDHQDYFPDYASIRDAFVEYGRKLPPGGELIYCADDQGATEVAGLLAQEGRGIVFTPYGWSAAGAFRITDYRVANERLWLNLAGCPVTLAMQVPGRHTACNAAGALALTTSLAQKETACTDGLTMPQWLRIREALEAFQGSKRRSEIIGERRGVLFMDDYGHHPTAIRTTLAGLREFYPQRRLVLSFMSHTYTRTAALFEEFAGAFDGADVVILHKIYSSARETYTGGLTGETLFEAVRARCPVVHYVAEPEEAAPLLRSMLRPGDLFITMGAGDNWKLAVAVFESFGD